MVDFEEICCGPLMYVKGPTTDFASLVISIRFAALEYGSVDDQPKNWKILEGLEGKA